MHVDLTTVPAGTGFWVPWMPFALPQSWPFCWWVAIALDHFSRAVVGFAVFAKRPTSAEVQRFLDRAIRRAGSSPRHIIADKGRQFWCDSFKRWCQRRGIQPRFGAVGKYGSIAVVERFLRSLKGECTRRMLVPLTLATMRREIGLYALWYNQVRPSMALAGSAPHEVFYGLRPANAMPRFEPRARWPTHSPCAAPQASIRARRGTTLRLIVAAFEDRKHLPIVELRTAA
jgi:transposase InsO family protein